MSLPLEKKKSSKGSKIVALPGRRPSDTVKVWDRYKDRAMLWRAIALLQMPVVAGLIIASLYFFISADTVLNIPLSPEPGSYSVKKLPDSLFISHATNVANLVSTYQPFTARRQYRAARKYLWEPGLSLFQKKYMETDLEAIEETSRSQVFYLDKERVRVERFDKYLVVKLPGVRQKFIHNRPLPSEKVAWYIKMTTIPRNVHNEYGIVITDLELRGAGEKKDKPSTPAKGG